MNIYVKIVMAGINIACLLVTLLNPNSATPVSLLPVIVTATSWVFLSRSVDSTFLALKRRQEYLIFSTVFAVFCIVLGLTSRIQPMKNDMISGYAIKFTEETAIAGGFCFDYLWFAATAFVTILCLIVSEVIYAFRRDFHDCNTKGNVSMHALVLKAIKQ